MLQFWNCSHNARCVCIYRLKCSKAISGWMGWVWKSLEAPLLRLRAPLCGPNKGWLQKKEDKTKMPFQMMMIDKQITWRVQFQIWHLQIGANPDWDSFRQEELWSIPTCLQSVKIVLKFGPGGWRCRIFSSFSSSIYVTRPLLHLSLNQLCLHFWTI